MITSLLFDIGNVIVTFDFARAVRRFAEQSPLAPDVIRERLMPLVMDMEAGRLTSAGFVQRAIEAVEYGGGDERFVAAYCDIFEENAPLVALVPRLAARRPLYLLSNTSGLHLDYLVAAFPVFAHFSGGVYSHLAASMKPEAKIYHDAIAVAGGHPSATLYLDDAPANTAAGTALGLKAFTYDWRDHSAVEAEFTRWGLL